MKNLSKRGKVNYFFTIISYILFAIFTISIIVFGSNTIFKWIVVVVFVFFFIAGIFVEYLNRKYLKALYALNFELNTNKAVALFDDLEKHDLLKGYKNTRIIFDAQVALEEKRFDDALKIIKDNDKIFRTDLELLSIMQYIKLRCYVAKKDTKRAAEAYKQLKMIYSQKKAPKIFSFDEIEGLYQMAIKNEFSAYKCFKNINMKTMNTREMKFIITCLRDLTPYQNEKEQYTEDLENIENLRISNEKQ